jgi:glyoxylase-like metal-dependent hydrolase (beta-lactamase superfamily II)
MTTRVQRFFLLGLVLAGALWLARADTGAQTPEQQIVNDAAAALGGRDRIMAVRSLLLEGQGKDFSFGQGARPDEMGSESDPWKVTGYKRAYDLAAGRSRFEQTRVSLDAFYAGPDPAKSVQGIDGAVVYDVGETGNASRVWNRTAIDGRRAEALRHPLTLLRAALDPATRLSNARSQGHERLVDITVANGPTLTLGVDAMSKLPTRVVHNTDVSLIGDTPVETRFGDYRPVEGLQLPTRFTTRIDRWLSADIRIRRQAVNGDVGNLAAPATVANATAPGAPAPIPVTAEEVAPGIWYMTGQTHNSVLVEFSDHLTLVEAPSEARTLAVIAKARELRPNKPLTTLVETHHHGDHTGGVRAAVSEGVTTIVAHKSIRWFLEELLKRPHTIAPDALAKKPQSRRVNFVDVDDSHVLKDSMNAINLYYVLDSAHADTNLLVYFPTARILTDADLYFPDDRRTVNDSDPQGHATFIHSLVVNINHRKLQIDRMMPIHGKLVPYDKFLEADMLLSSMLSAQQ